jgi:Outer membrane protein beta-barrel domain
MKKAYILLVLSFLALCAQGQLGYGPEIGVGMSTFKTSPPTDPILYTSSSVSSILAGRVGFLIDVSLSKHLYFQSGVYVSRKGGERSFSYHFNDSFNEQVHQSMHINYFDVPIGVVFKKGLQGRGRIMAGISGQPSLIIGGRTMLDDKQVFAGIDSNTKAYGKIESDKTLRGFDIALLITLGYEAATGLFVRTWYSSGVNDLGIGSEIIKNRSWGLSAGYIFGKGRNINKDVDDLIDKTK